MKTTMTLEQLAFDVKKPTKKEAQAIVRDLFDRHPEAGRELARLYSHFMPTPPRKPRNRFEFVAKAVSKDATKENMRFVYVDEEYIVATDGHRMHYCENDAGDGGTVLEPGYYNPKTGERVYDEDYFLFPDYKRIINQVTKDIYTRWVVGGVIPVTQTIDGDECDCFDLLANDTTRVNAKYYYDAMSYEDTQTTTKTPMDAVLVAGDTVYAIIMPVRIPVRRPEED